VHIAGNGRGAQEEPPTAALLATVRDNHNLFVGSGGFVSVYDRATGTEKERVLGTGQVNAITRHPSLDFLYAAATA
jgi:hypothetical protein